MKYLTTTKNDDFQTSWRKWKIRYIFNFKKYWTGHPKDIWNRIDSHQLDSIFDHLAQIYLRASSSEKNIIDDYVKARDKLSWELVIYIRRIALRLQSKRDEELIHKALAITSLVQKSDDPCDILNSLVLLRIGAEKAGFDVKTWFNKIDSASISNVNSIFYKTEHQTEESINNTIKDFGPSEWI